MQDHKVLLTWEAIYDIIDIADYIELGFGENRANQFQEDMKEEVKKLSYLGGIFGCTNIFYRNLNIHKKLFSSSIIFYVVKEEEKEVHILRVLRQESEWERILKHNQEYTYPE